MNRATFVFAVALSLSGCGIIDSCNDTSVTQDVIFDSPAYQVQSDIVANYRKDGWACRGETLYNAFGNSFGTRYTCTKCD